MGAADRVWEVGDKRCGPSVRIHLYHAGDILPGEVVTEHEIRRRQRGRIHRFAELDSVGSVHRHVDSPTRHARRDHGRRRCIDELCRPERALELRRHLVSRFIPQILYDDREVGEACQLRRWGEGHRKPIVR